MTNVDAKTHNLDTDRINDRDRPYVSLVGENTEHENLVEEVENRSAGFKKIFFGAACTSACTLR